ncbi:hypothetical protein FA15DRAFT_666682 [Coprinopsis marcescibilis]|uniref:DUF4112 domain-containing protein n=1 Tax=Coprinopsis marcescibilis TaxID=230819 RepID=A0A5C3L3I7_COPMA|nr:hypothetical protein FA15DRAFT_666682 [Coprinopsis marcescibilis]
MATLVLGKAGKELFERHLEQYSPADPLYETYTDEQGRQKRRKRELPPGLSKRDAGILRSVKRRAHYLDKGFSLCGLRFGWTFLISLIPVVGDVTDAGLNYCLVVKKAKQAELPPWLVRQMMLNNAFSFAISFIPFVGDVILAVFKANSRNAALLEEYLRIRGEEYLKLNPKGSEIQPKKNGWFGAFGSKKNTPPTAAQASSSTPQTVATSAPSGLSKHDAHQIKPGSGVQPGESVEGTQNAVPVQHATV